MHDTPNEVQAAAIIAAATIYAASIPKESDKLPPTDDEAAKRVADIAAKILANITG